jgi:hypothetical protein
MLDKGMLQSERLLIKNTSDPNCMRPLASKPLVHVCAALARFPVTRRADRPIVGGLMHQCKPRRLEHMQVRLRHNKCLRPLKLVPSYAMVC